LVTRSTGAVAAGDRQTAEAGAQLLEAGGSAVDAICAAAFAAFVAEPPLCSPAGAGALLFGDVRHGFHLLDFFACAPGRGLKAAPAQLDFHVVDVDFGPTVQQFHVGRASVAVPGALPGLLEAHRRAGRLPLAEVVAPAIALAREGYTLAPAVQYIIDILRPIVSLTPGMRTIFGAEHGIPAPGSRLTNPALADFFEQLAHDGEALVRGPLFDALVDEFGPAHGGLLTRDDLNGFRPVLRRPLEVASGNYVVLTNPPPSSGGALIGLGLRLAQGVLPTDSTSHGGAQYVLEIATILRALAQARARGYDELVREPDAAARLFSPESMAQLQQIHDDLRVENHLGSTTHISVLDTEGEAASLTMSNGEGCGHALDAFGISVNNFLGEEDINPGGFHRWPPGRRMTTMMAPTIVLADGRPVLVLGSGGSNRIRSAILQVLTNRLTSGLTLADAVQAPRVHVEGARLWYEAQGLAAGAEASLREHWADTTRFDTRSMFFGGVHAVGFDRDALVGAGDPRRGGAVCIVRP
jgi:gamma-glutamyltranspeptidase / glutathione hydrolase